MDIIEVQENNIKEKEFSIVEFYKKHNFLLNCVVLSCLFLANCFLSYFTYIAHIFVLLLVIISETKVAVGYLVFSFPFNSIYLPYSAICFGVCVFAMMVKLCIIKYKEDRNSFKVSKTTIILLIAFVVYLMLFISFFIFKNNVIK